MSETLIALKAYTYKGKRLKPRDTFTATPEDAKLLTKLGRAARVTPAPSPEPESPPQPEPEPTPEPSILTEQNQDHYETVTLTPEGESSPPATEPAVEADEPPLDVPPKRRGRYARRDLRADE